jgi:hypothetical protein
MKDGFLPRSIRIKCQLTTSEDYRQDETFLQLQKLQDQHVAEFHENALDVFTKWHDRLINLINKDRLIYFLAKGTAILSRMIVFFQHCTNFKINWPSVTDTDICNKEYRQKILTLFLFKLYTSKHIMDISPLLEFLEVSNKEFTSVGAKLILNTNNDIKVEQEFHRLNVLHFNPSKKSEFEFVQEVLLSFDSILRYTSLELWNDKSLANRKATASEALEASLKADDITNTTELVAETIAKAKNNIQHKNEIQTNLELRMTNLEKMLTKHQQQQKNYKGGRPEHRSSLTSRTAPPTHNHYNQNNRNITIPPKNHRQLQVKFQQTHESESANQKHHEQKHKSHTRKTHPQNTNQSKKRLYNPPKITNNKKRKIFTQHQEPHSDSNSLTSQSTTSDLPSLPQHNRLYKNQHQRNQDAKPKGQNSERKRRRN